MKQKKQKYIGNLFSGVSALALLLMSALPAFLGPQTVYAAGVVSSRRIMMSSSNPGAPAGSVSYDVSYTPASTTSIEGIIVDFCSNSPIIGASCTAPTGFSIGAPTVTYASSMGTGWTASALTSSTLELNNTTAQTQSTSVSDSFTITTVTNPTTTGSFYARILTYASDSTSGADPASYTAITPGTYVDEGGVALSTTSVIDISATVQETLSFCVYPGSGVCGSSPSFTMGHNVSGVTIIDSSAVYTNPIDFSLSTNALDGAAVNLYGGTLTSGTNTIPAIGASATAITAGTADFGLYLSTEGTDVTPVSPYTYSASSSAATYALDTNTSTGTLSPYGQEVASLSAPVNNSISQITYGVTASNTTPAGIYTATHQLIATATF